MNRTHLNALELNLSNERLRFAAASGKEKELRAVWIAQLEKEISAEKKFLGVDDQVEMSDEEILSKLFD